MSARVAKPVDPRLCLSFFRRATKQEVEAGFKGYFSWNVTASGDHSADYAHGEALAEEALAFMAAHPTYGNLLLISDMISDAFRVGDVSHRSLLLGFGRRIGEIATMTVAAVGMDAIRATEACDDKAA